MTQMDARTLRNVLGCYATGVAIITTRSSTDVHVGVTVNSFASVSLDPPLVLFSIARTANVLAALQQAKSFAVNILGQGQQDISNMFAKPSTARCNDVRMTNGRNNCALFSDSLSQLECDKAMEVDGGDHVIFIGRVTDTHLNSPSEPLLFFRGAYGTYTRDQWSKMPPQDSSLYNFSITGWG